MDSFSWELAYLLENQKATSCLTLRSSAGAEYRSMATTTCELKWLKALLLSLDVPHSSPMKIYCDSQSALHIAANPVFHQRTKHIEVDCHFLRDEHLNGNISTHHMSTNIQLANIFTKALGKQQFDHFLNKLGNLYIANNFMLILSYQHIMPPAVHISNL
jgi:hypothetical protein